MDGNGRWAKQRFMPRVAGHKRGVETVRAMVKACIARGVEYLTLFAFSSENWRRPAEEVSFLMNLFVSALQSEIGKLHANAVRLKVVGDLAAFDPRLVALIREGEATTANNSRLTLTIAANYGGRWDILQAMNQLALAHPEKVGIFGEADLAPHLTLAAPAASSASAIFCFGSWPTANCTSPKRSGRISTTPPWMPPSRRIGGANAALAAPASN
jgi:undecaprenyl diphosphate synthase